MFLQPQLPPTPAAETITYTPSQMHALSSFALFLSKNEQATESEIRLLNEGLANYGIGTLVPVGNGVYKLITFEGVNGCREFPNGQKFHVNISYFTVTHSDQWGFTLREVPNPDDPYATISGSSC